MRTPLLILLSMLASLGFSQIDFDYTTTAVFQEVVFKYNPNFYNKFVAGGFVVRDEAYVCVGSDTLDYSFNQSPKRFKVYGENSGDPGFQDSEELLFFIFPFNADSCALKVDLFLENGSTEIFTEGASTVIDSCHAIRGTVEYPGEACLGDGIILPTVNIPYLITFSNESSSSFSVDTETGALDLMNSTAGAHIIGFESNHCLNQESWPMNFRDFPVQFVEEDDLVYCKGDNLSFWTSAMSGNLTRTSLENIPTEAVFDDTLSFQLSYSPTGCNIENDIVINVRDADGMENSAIVTNETCEGLGGIILAPHGADQRDTMYINYYWNKQSTLPNLVENTYQIHMYSEEGCADTILVTVVKDTSSFPLEELNQVLQVCAGDKIMVANTGTNSSFIRDVSGFLEVADMDEMFTFMASYGSCVAKDSVFVEVQDLSDLAPSITVVDAFCDSLGSVTVELVTPDELLLTSALIRNESGELLDSNAVLRFENLPADLYEVEAYSELGCSIVLAQPTVKSTLTDFLNWNVSVIDKTCDLLGEIEVSDNGTGELNRIVLLNGVDTISTSVTNVISEIEEGNYSLIMYSHDGCSHEVTFEISFDGNCEGEIIYLVPNLNGPKKITFEEEGPIKIYNKAGFLLKALEGPVVWDGTAEDGTFLPSGAYVVVYEDGSSKLLHVVD